MKKILIAGAAGAMMFGLTAASASTLNLSESGWFTHTVQQSDKVTVSCTDKAVEVKIIVDGLKVNQVDLLQQYVQSCGGKEAQVVAYLKNAQNPIASAKTRIVANGLNVPLTFATALVAQDIASVRVTIADEIRTPPTAP